MGRSSMTRRGLAAMVCISGLLAPASSRAERPAPGPQAPSSSAPSTARARVTFTGTIVDTAGRPLPKAVVSVVGEITASGITDAQGRASVPGLVPGPYLVRVFLEGYTTPSAIVHVRGGMPPWSTTLSRASDAADAVPVLEAGMGPAEPVQPRQEAGAPAPGEFVWRLRHLRRGALKDLAAGLDVVDAPGAFMEDSLAALAHAIGRPVRRATDFLADFPLAGHIDLMTTASFDRPQDVWTMQGDIPRSLASIALSAPVGSGRWQLRGGATQGELTSWMVAGSYSARPEGSVHQYEAGMSFAAQRYDQAPGTAGSELLNRRSAGEVYAFDTWTLGTRGSVNYGGRYARYDYLSQSGLFSPRVEVSITPVPALGLRVSGLASRRYRAPGADEFQDGARGIWLPAGRSFSPLVGALGFLAERLDRFDVRAEQPLGSGVSATGVVFRQYVDNQNATVFGSSREPRGRTTGHYFVTPTGDVDVRGWSVGLERHTDTGLRTAVAYTDASARWTSASAPIVAMLATLSPALVHRPDERVRDVTASAEGRVPLVDTRFAVLYRVDVLDVRPDTAGGVTPARFDVQLSQALPFLNFNGSRWQAVVSLRNLVYTDLSDTSLYDEVSVVRPPKLVAGGVTVRF